MLSSRHFAEGTDENHENAELLKSIPRRDFKRGPPEYKSRVLPLRQPAQLIRVR
jgi:hypothetical protein